LKAIVFPEPGRFSLTEVPDPVAGPREVVVRVEAVGICGTDVHVLDGEFAPTRYPIIPGHETSGVVESVGRDVHEVEPGDRVSVDPTLVCGECQFCAEGRSNLCERWDGSGVARTNGSTAELTVAPVRNVHRLPDHVDLALAALVEPLACAIHGYDLLPRRMGQHYLIYGAGPMGLMMAQLAPRAGAASVTVVDRLPDRLETARQVGIRARRHVGRRRAAARVAGMSSSTAPVHRPPSRTGSPGSAAGGYFQQFGVAPTEATATCLARSGSTTTRSRRRLDGGAAVLRPSRRDVRCGRPGRRGHDQRRLPPRRLRRRHRRVPPGLGTQTQIRPGLSTAGNWARKPQPAP
jgi:2-desacetyl-2-hydroxyethyl bacteriochlorophyllide A dehydrogenase